MALTLDGTTQMPNFGGSSHAGIGALGGGVAGLLLGSMLNNGGGGLFGGYGRNGGPATTAVATDIVMNPAFQSLQAQVTGIGNQISTSGLHNQIEHEQDEVTHGIDRLDAQLTSGQAALADQISNFATTAAGMNFTTLQSINGLGNQITTQSNQNALQQLNSFNQLNVTTLQGFNQAAFNQNIATQQIIAGQVAAAATAAQCCCDIKSLITSDGGLTRTLINDLNVQNLRDQLTAANNQVSNYQQNQFLISSLRSERGSAIV